MFCPYYKNKEVFDGFNSIVEALGGKPLTEEEFMSAELRNLRSGLDFSAMEGAYRVYHLNNGNLLDLAPNGEPSLLYLLLLQAYNGDQLKAIKAKANLYSKKFREIFGDWTEKEIPGKTDINGEPILKLDNELKAAVERKAVDSFFGFNVLFLLANIQTTFGEDISNKLNNGDSVSSKDVISYLKKTKSFSFHNNNIAELLSHHDVPIKFQSHNDGILAKAHTIDGGTYITIDPIVMQSVSNRYVADTILHEMIHAITVDSINNPKTSEQAEFAKQNKIVYDIFNKLYPEYLYGRLDPYSRFYALSSEKEFAAVFATDKDVRSMLFLRAVLEDSKNNKAPIRAIKSLVNSVSRLFANKNIFNTNKDLLKLYQKIFNSYILNKLTINKGGFTNELILKAVYRNTNNNILANELDQEERVDLLYILDTAEENNSMRVTPITTAELGIGEVDSKEKALKAINKLSNDIATALSKRIAAIRVSDLAPEYKSLNINVLQSLVLLFKSNMVTTFLALSSLLSYISPELLKDSKAVRNIRLNNLTTSDSEYMYLAHDNFGTYEKILSEIENVLTSQTVVDLLVDQMKSLPEQDRAIVKDVEKLVLITLSAKNVANGAKSLMENILINNMKKRFANIGNATHSPSMRDYLNHLETIGYDTSWFFTTIGSVDKAKDDALRSLAYLIDDATLKADRKTFDRTAELMRLKDNLSLNEHVTDLYEKNKDGLTTGYLIRKLNYGQFFLDYNKFLSDLNIKFGLDPSNRSQPEGEDGVTWNKARNEWLKEHCHRKYLPKYYEAFAKLSQETITARELILGLIKTIKEKCKDEFGNYHFDRLTDSEWNTLRGLYILKKLLASLRDINGELKIEGTPEYKIAKELQELNNTLFNSLLKIAKDAKRWSEDRAKIIEQCGGIEEMQKGEEGSFDFEKLKKWDSRNSKTRLKLNENTGKALLWEAIDRESNLEGEEATYDVITNGISDGGKRYQELQDEKREIMSIYRDYNTGDIDPSKMNKSIQLKIKAINKELSKIKKQAIKRDSSKKKLAIKRAKAFKKFAKSLLTDTYKEMRRLAKLRDRTEPGYYDSFLQSTGSIIIDDETGTEAWEANPWFRKVVAKNQYYDQFMEVVPGDGYINSDENNDLLDKDFDESQKMTFVPKKELYDNSTEYNKIMKSKGLKSLYEKIYLTISESNELSGALQYHDNYLLPQITGSYFKYMKKHSGKWRAAWDYIKYGTTDPSETYIKRLKKALSKGYDNSKLQASVEFAKDMFGIGERAFEQDGTYGLLVDSALLDEDEFGNIINLDNDTFGGEVKGERPDGRLLNLIPFYYSRKLKDTSLLSSDLIGIVCEYYNQANKFRNKKDIEATCESIADMINNRNHLKVSITGSIKNLKITKRNITGKESNTYKAARKFLDMNLYNIRDSRVIFNVFGRQFNFGKFAALFRSFTTLVNLGCNIAVAGTGFLTSCWSNVINAIIGQKYNIPELALATRFVLFHITKNLFGVRYIDNHSSKDLLMCIMEKFNIADQLNRKMKNSNRNHLVNIINNNWAFGMMTTFDFLAKAPIAVATLMSYRYYNGEFITRDDVMMNNVLSSEQEIKSAIKEWKKGKNLISILKVKDGKIEVDPQYKQAYDLIELVINSRMQKYAESCDGMATESQKAMITTNALGAAILTHRQYFPLMLLERFGETVWDYATLQYVGGSFRTAALFAKILTLGYFDLQNLLNFQPNRISGALKGMSGGLVAGLILGGPVSAAIGAALGAGLGAIHSKSIQRYLYDTSSEEKARLSRFRRQLLKRIAAEVVLFNTVVVPMLAILSAYADDDDNKENLLLLLVTYIALRTMWEVYTPYRADDALNNFKTVTAQTGTIDKMLAAGSGVLNMLQYRLFPQGSLLDTYLGRGNSDKLEIKRGLYHDRNIPFTDIPWTTDTRDMFKATPFKHTYEQIYDSKSKRKYQENQIFHKKQSDNPIYQYTQNYLQNNE